MPHDAGDDAFVVILGQRGRAFGIEALAFPAADDPLPRPRRGHIHRAAGVFQDAGDVVGVQNRERGFEPQHRAVLAQHAHAQRVKSADHHVPGGAANQLLGAFTHLGGGLVGEGDGGNAIRRHSGLDQAANFVRDHPRLARAGTRQH